MFETKTARMMIILGGALLLPGCGANTRDAPSAAAGKPAGGEAVSPQTHLVRGPELHMQKYRTLFYGYNTVSYHLEAIKPDSPPGAASYRLVFDANYGAQKERHYDLAIMANGVSYPLVDSRRDTQRCQLFGDMVSACIFRQRSAVELDAATLEAARQSGLVVTLGSKDIAYESLELPGDYVTGFLRSVAGSSPQ